MPSREGLDLMAKHFPAGELAPVQVIVNTEGKDIKLKESFSTLSFAEKIPTIKKLVSDSLTTAGIPSRLLRMEGILSSYDSN
jgi:hypothetical protein